MSDYEQTLGAFQVFLALSGIKTEHPPVTTAKMSRRFALRLADMIFECTDAQNDPDLMAFAHQLKNLNEAAYSYATRFGILPRTNNANNGHNQAFRRTSPQSAG